MHLLSPNYLSTYEEVVTFIRTIIASSGVGVTIISVGALIGYALNIVGLFKWDGLETPMALPTAICFLLVGLSLIAMAFYSGFWKRRNGH